MPMADYTSRRRWRSYRSVAAVSGGPRETHRKATSGEPDGPVICRHAAKRQRTPRSQRPGSPVQLRAKALDRPSRASLCARRNELLPHRRASACARARQSFLGKSREIRLAQATNRPAGQAPQAKRQRRSKADRAANADPQRSTKSLRLSQSTSARLRALTVKHRRVRRRYLIGREHVSRAAEFAGHGDLAVFDHIVAVLLGKAPQHGLDASART